MESGMNRFCYLLKAGKLDFKQYQYDGVQWCLRNELRANPDPLENVRGGLIVDEMGLGKTIMMIGTMFANLVPRTLIVLPPILIQQWYKEIYRTSGHKAVVFYGVGKKNLTKETLEKARIVLTSYNHIAVGKKEAKLGILHSILWDRVIFDEGHHLRNKHTIRFLGCKHVNAPIRWFVTGTPIQNKKTDFYSLCNALGIPPDYYTNNANITIIKELFILKRTKQDVGIDLPTINETNTVVSWENIREKKMSEEIHSVIKMTGVSDKRSGQFAKQLIADKGPLIAILRARQSCIMLSLMQHTVHNLVLNGQLSESYLNPFRNERGLGSKMNAVVDFILKRKNNGKGKIIFCHFQKEIDALATRFRENNMTVAIFDGRSHGKKKMKNISEKFDILILQIQTGCEGLNLQENYSEVYFVSPHWNPSIEDQAVARCHRIGQRHNVEVFKFIMNDFDIEKEKNTNVNPITLEKYICSVQDIKRKIRDDILVGEGGK